MKNSILKTLAAFMVIGLIFSCDDGKKKKEDDPLTTLFVSNPVILLAYTCQPNISSYKLVNVDTNSNQSLPFNSAEVGRGIHSLKFIEFTGTPDCKFSNLTMKPASIAALPNGVTYDQATKTLSGTPTATMAQTDFEFDYTLSSALSGASANKTATLRLTVVAAGNLTCVSAGGGKYTCPNANGGKYNSLELCQAALVCGF
ncbi:putative Ig domain-containing protein [Leptospira adleri]|uniref:putative Ig domain-containing protein n=1 Tax=Leptospira adleri TaxID=2023186 RepID=UPI0010847F32|nr:putative Ig domain-containing protein [Leptospira adleri]TGM57152.1 hypothetical protein EHQ97_10105 [Leptospira adleri]